MRLSAVFLQTVTVTQLDLYLHHPVRFQRSEINHDQEGSLFFSNFEITDFFAEMVVHFKAQSVIGVLDRITAPLPFLT